jgi:hypothetical protein
VLPPYQRAWDVVQAWCDALLCRDADAFAKAVPSNAHRDEIKTRIENGEILLANGRAFATAQAVLAQEDGWRGLRLSLESDLERLGAFIGSKQRDGWVEERRGCYTEDPSFMTAIYDTWAVGTAAYELAFGQPTIDRRKLTRAQSLLTEAVECHKQRYEQQTGLNRWALAERKTLRSHLRQVNQLLGTN